MEEVECPVCHQHTANCPFCGGTGWVPEDVANEYRTTKREERRVETNLAASRRPGGGKMYVKKSMFVRG